MNIGYEITNNEDVMKGLIEIKNLQTSIKHAKTRIDKIEKMIDELIDEKTKSSNTIYPINKKKEA